jgi:flagellar basal-body rod protein FlgG
MIRSFYTATSGAITENKSLNVISGNIANVQTSGYKRDIPLSEDFAEKLLTRLAMADTGTVGEAVFGRTLSETYTDHSQGAFQETERTLDFALRGDGYFAVENEDDGEINWTRSGECYLDDAGYLRHVRGGYMLDDGENRIQLTGADFTVESRGYIIQNDEEVGRLGVYMTEDLEALQKTGVGFFTQPEDDYLLDAMEVMQGVLERSNTNMTQEMAAALVSARDFQTYSQVMKMIDTLTQQTVTEIARM